MEKRSKIIIPVITGLLLATMTGCTLPAALTPAKALYKRYTNAMASTTQYNYSASLSVTTSEDGLKQIADTMEDTDTLRSFEFTIEAEGTYNGDEQIATMDLSVQDTSSDYTLNENTEDENEEETVIETDLTAEAGEEEDSSLENSAENSEDSSDTKAYSVDGILVSGDTVYLRNIDRNFENITEAYAADVQYPADQDTTAVFTIPEDYGNLLWSQEERDETALAAAESETYENIDREFSKEKKVPSILVQNIEPGETADLFFNSLEDSSDFYDWLNALVDGMETAVLDPDTQNQLVKIFRGYDDGSLSVNSAGNVLLDANICERDSGAMLDEGSLELLSGIGNFIDTLNELASMNDESERSEKINELNQNISDTELVYQYESSIQKISDTEYLKTTTLTLCTMHNANFAIPVYTITLTFDMTEAAQDAYDLSIPASSMESPDLFKTLLDAFYKEPIEEETEKSGTEEDTEEDEAFSPILEIGDVSSTVSATSANGTYVALDFDGTTVYMLKNEYDENQKGTVNIFQNSNDVENERWEVISGIQSTLTLDNIDVIAMSHSFYEYPLDTGYIGQYDSSENMLETMTANIQYVSQSGGIEERDVKFANGWNYKVTVAVSSTSAEMYCLRVDNEQCIELIHIMTTDSSYLKELMDMLAPDATQDSEFKSSYEPPEETEETEEVITTTQPTSSGTSSTGNSNQINTNTSTGSNNSSSGTSNNSSTGTNTGTSTNNSTPDDNTSGTTIGGNTSGGSSGSSSDDSNGDSTSTNTGTDTDPDNTGNNTSGNSADSDTGSGEQETDPSPSPSVSPSAKGAPLTSGDYKSHTMYYVTGSGSASPTVDSSADDYTKRVLESSANGIYLTDENYEFVGNYTSLWSGDLTRGGQVENNIIDSYVSALEGSADSSLMQTGTYYYKNVSYTKDGSSHSIMIFAKVSTDGQEANVLIVEVLAGTYTSSDIVDYLSDK